MFIFNFILSTLNQLNRRITLKKKAHHTSPALKKCPQVKGVVKRPRIVTPRKPNSARRPVAKVILSNRKRVTSHLPGVGYTCIRGVYDFASLSHKKRKRSLFGVKKPIVGVKKLRRKFRFK